MSSKQATLAGEVVTPTDAERAAELFQEHRDELGFVNVAQCEEGDLLLVERDGEVVGALLGNHCVRKPQSTVYELAVSDAVRRGGIGTELVDRFADESPHDKLVAKCPTELPSNEFYRATGWTHVETEDGKNRPLNVWERHLNTAERSKESRENGRELVHHDRDAGRSVICPDCRADVTDTKGSHALPDEFDPSVTHGWACEDCLNTFPTRAHSADAPSFNDHFAGYSATFRDGSEQWIPVPAQQLTSPDNTSEAGE
jgi:N-acetylglutamate synthase-like GNAT family acetyltransferase